MSKRLFAIVLAVAAGTAVLAIPKSVAAGRESIELQLGLAQLAKAQTDTQTTIAEGHAAAIALLEFASNSLKSLSEPMATAVRSMQDMQENSDSRLENASAEVKSDTANVQELPIQMNDLDQRLGNMLSTLNGINAKLPIRRPHPFHAVPGRQNPMTRQ